MKLGHTIVGLSLAVAATAFAQAPAPTAPAPAPAAVQLPPLKCTKVEFPGKLASDMQIKVFNRDYKAYADCLRQYVGELQNIIKTADAEAKRVVDDFNAYNDALKIEQDKAKE